MCDGTVVLSFFHKKQKQTNKQKLVSFQKTQQQKVKEQLYFRFSLGAGEVTWWLRALDALVEDQGLVPDTHMVA